jgi:RNA polymerase sigma-70 factor (ECF subfamily)
VSPEAAADGELVARVLAGERDAYAELVRRHQEPLLRYAYGMVSDQDAAADLVQDGLVKAYASLATCQEPARFGAWLFRIVKNRCTDYLKEHRRRDVPLEPDAPFVSDRDDPARDLERARLRGAVERALAELPEAQRDAFLLKHVEGRSYEEMAEMLGDGVSALKMRVMRAREALKASLERAGHASGHEV